MIAATALIAKNTALLSNLSQKPASIPDTFPPSEVVMNHPPIINAVNRGGASFETNERPIGLKQISLTVNTP